MVCVPASLARSIRVAQTINKQSLDCAIVLNSVPENHSLIIFKTFTFQSTVINDIEAFRRNHSLFPRAVPFIDDVQEKLASVL